MAPQGSNQSAFIEIPGEATLWKVNAGAKRLALPFAAGPHVVGQSLCALLGLGIGMPSIFAAAMLLLQIGSAEGAMIALPLVVSPLLGVLGILLTEWGAASVRNLVRRSPLVIIDETGLWGARLRQSIRWTDTERAKIDIRPKSGIVGVNLRLKSPVANPFRLLRLTDWIDRWLDEPDLVHVPVTLLNESRHTVSQAIIRMAEKHGAEIVSP